MSTTIARTLMSLTVIATAIAGTLQVAVPSAAQAGAAREAITWVDCPDRMPEGVECGRLDVPIDWAQPDDPRRASIAFAVHRATGKRIGTYTYNPGGPGTGGMDVLEFLLTGGPYGPSGALPASIQRHFDIVAWDPRGVAGSTPQLQGCDGTATFGELPQAGPVDWSAVATAYADSLGTTLRQCLEANPDLAPYLGTHYVIRDLDALRQALGVQQWTYNGVSYGTTVGLAYAREYPSRLRAMVLDGVAPTNQTQLQQASTMAWAWSTMLRVFAGTFPAGLSAKINRVITSLDEGPLDLRGEPYPRFAENLYGLDGLISGLWGQGRYQSKREQFVALDAAARERGPVPGPVSPLPALQRPIDPVVSFVLCADRPDRPTVAQAAAIAETAASAGLTVAGTHAIERGLWCSGLPPIGVPIDASSEPVQLANSAVVVNATGDPKTPWLRARVGASLVQGARLISYTGTQHGVYRRVGSTCVDDPITRYLMTLRLPAGDLACPFTTAN
ncbi:MAG: alpha/beta fold hydrolase [Candidatus Nanopelagicales bacterium]